MAPDLSSGRAVVVGNGNVALDVARILVTDPDVLATTDIADHALKSLHDRGVEEVVVIGRRGPLQAPFTTLELRELGDLEGLGDVDVIVDPADFADITDEDLEAAGKTVRNNIKVLRGYAEREPRGRQAAHRVPVPHVADRDQGRRQGRVDRVGPQRTGRRRQRPRRRPRTPASARRCPRSWWSARSATAACRRRACRSTSKHGTIPHTNGRVEGSRNEYVVGWIKRGPTGRDRQQQEATRRRPSTRWSRDLAGADLADFAEDHSEKLAEWLLERQPKLVTDDHWKLIDDHERGAGGTGGRPRVKLTSVAELLRIGHG